MAQRRRVDQRVGSRAVAPSKHHLAVIFGGRSSEHGISCVSAGNVLAAVDRERWDVTPIGITRDGAWTLAPDEPDRYAIRNGVVPEVASGGERVMFPPDPAIGGVVFADGRIAEIDVVFPVLHGYGGEDGALQGVCELAGVPFVGSGVAASAVCMDKIRTKEALRAAGIPIGPYVGITDHAWNTQRAAVLAQIATLGLPVFVKPARAGSSVGISRVTTAAEIEAAVTAARSHDRRVIVEAAVQQAREIECGVLATLAGPIVSECAEITVLGDHSFYDFTAKYLDGSAEITLPAALTINERAHIQALAVRAFTALGCEGMARVDTFLTAEGEVLLNEPNTIPGFTATSMYPAVWQASGVSYPDLINALCEDALRRGANPEVSGR